MNMTNSKFYNSFIGSLSIIILRILLDWTYINVVSRFFLYQGFKNNTSSFMCVISWIILLTGIVLFNYLRKSMDDRGSTISICILFTVSFVPFTTCVYAGVFPVGYIVFNTIYWFVLLLGQYFSLLFPFKRLPVFTINGARLGDVAVRIIGFFSVALVFIISAVYTHFRFSFDLFSVYDFRSESLGYNIPTSISYLFAWTRAINPVLLACSLIKKDKLNTVLFLIAQLLSFGIDGLKTTFFMPFVVILAVCFYSRLNTVQIKTWIGIVLASILTLGVFESIILKTHVIAELFTRRIMFMTNIIGGYYYDFFTINTPDYFRGGFLKYLGFKSPYASTGGVSYTIGANYFRDGINYNNGLSSDAIANLGWIGVIVMPIIVIIILRIFDRSAHGLDKRIVIASSLYVTIMLLSSFMGTILLTHGVLVLIIILSMLNRKNNTDNNEMNAEE